MTLKLALLFWLLTSVGFAEELQLRIPTNLAEPPPVRKISGIPKYVPQVDTVYRLEAGWLASERDPCRFEIQQEGYEAVQFQLTRQTFNALPLDPANPSIRLHPELRFRSKGEFWLANWLRNHPWLAGAGALLLLAGLLTSAQRHRESLRDRQKLEKMSRISESNGDPMVGLRIQNYFLTGRLGSGGMATVYRAIPFDTMQESDAVALKILNSDPSDPDFLPRFRREVEVLAGLQHPNVLRLLDWGEHEGLFFLVTELVEGRPLRAPEGGMAIADFQSILPSLSAGILYAHGRGVVHRDLKPDNLMRLPNGDIKIMDFGMARGQQMKTVTATGTALGTPSYMAPEQILGHKPTPLCDQYSLGITFYELLCGRLPFVQEEMMSLLRAQLQEEAMPLQMYRPELSLELEQVIMRMICKQSERRYPTLVEALTELQQSVADMLASPHL